VPHAYVNQAQRVMCEPAAHNRRHQGMPVLPMPFSVPERQRLPSQYRPGFRGDSEKATVKETVAFPRFSRIFFTIDEDAQLVRVVHVRRSARQPPLPEELRGE
jgi:hypothetical protein